MFFFVLFMLVVVVRRLAFDFEGIIHPTALMTDSRKLTDRHQRPGTFVLERNHVLFVFFRLVSSRLASPTFSQTPHRPQIRAKQSSFLRNGRERRSQKTSSYLIWIRRKQKVLRYTSTDFSFGRFL
mmetsp:Transcript_15520/g.26925  ORF Transcript_15520/g.26925 Transcript_15520/m.26925 type:complete len:126 (+) Transcript_15520:400-777(+)